jgi:hypothetical protein
MHQSLSSEHPPGLSTIAARACAIYALIILSAVGCQRNGIATYQVEGTLKYAGTEETIPGAGVELRPEKPSEGEHHGSIVGRVRADGTIVFTTFEPGDGVPAGTHRVMLIEPPFRREWDIDTQGAPPAKIPRKYRSYQTSGISLTVGPGSENRLEIVVEKPGG